jgi:hypothetical protein
VTHRTSIEPRVVRLHSSGHHVFVVGVFGGVFVVALTPPTLDATRDRQQG